MSKIDKYDRLDTNDAMLFAIAKAQTLLNALNGETRCGFGGEEDIPWVRETCDEIVAILERASELAPFK